MNVPIINRQANLLKKIVKGLNINNGFVDVGCGEGHNLELLSNLDIKGIGVDVSREAIGLAKARNLKNIILLCSDFNKLNLKKKDLVLFLFVLEHIKDDYAALKKINSFLTLGGNLIISVPAHSRLYSFQDKLAGHYRRYDKEEIIRKLNHAGFSIQRFLCIGFPISNIYLSIYNLSLSLFNRKVRIITENTKITGIRSKQRHILPPFRMFSNVAFPFLTFLINLDFLFLKTDFGTHYIILAKKTHQGG